MIRANYTQKTLKFRFTAKTSRGSMVEKKSWYIKIYDQDHPTIFGVGEASPLEGLSIDSIAEFEQVLQETCYSIEQFNLPQLNEDFYSVLNMVIPTGFPSIYFGFETAILDFLNGGKRKIFDNDFYHGKKTLATNGLIWMGNSLMMKEQVEAKLNDGYSCIKMKIGAIDFEEELSLLRSIREKYSKQQITLRVDANGAFSEQNVFSALEELTKLDIHSIEQPVAPKQHELMKRVCALSPVPIALDEELIGIETKKEKEALLELLKPQYIILKPTLVGGFKACDEWIEAAESRNIDWWMTSALESNIGLNAIAQYTAGKNNPLPQGLGTGKLYHNNINSPLDLKRGALGYNTASEWEEDFA